ncbi:hypothetical protein FDO65_06990 [Nakamurella flava]|uniref:Uncharacterized protein n=1 Tax=Nakamurella flava TaxID=2576308 RepID=A0A4U6QLA3_9ACTN|nr:hypothetical protein [Nakamurella flava]TKV61337.1 hypothetical protein FDO65_06990 [Nakamurella flava]
MAWTHTRSELGNAIKLGADEKTVADLRRQLRADKLAEHIKKVVDQAPPLTAEQRDRLAALLRAGGGNAAA